MDLHCQIDVPDLPCPACAGCDGAGPVVFRSLATGKIEKKRLDDVVFRKSASNRSRMHYSVHKRCINYAA